MQLARPYRPGLRIATTVPPLVVALALAFMLPSPAAAAPRAPRVVFAAGGWSFPSTDTLDRLRRSGLRTWRLTMSWATVAPQAGRMEFSGYDRVLRDAERNRIEVLVTLTGCPVWACPNGGPPVGPALSGFQAFVREAVRRYGHRGTAFGHRPRVPVRYWQVLNEVNGRDQWGGRPSPKGYAKVLRATSRTIRHNDRRAKVVLAGLGERMDSWMFRYLPLLYKVKGFKRSFDVMAPEGYAVHPNGVVRVMRLTRKIQRRFHDSKKPVFITEMGWSSGGPPFPFTTSEAGQAARMRSSWRTLAACGKRWKVRRVYWFSYSDIEPAPSQDYWGFHNGLLDKAGRAKPAWHTFVKFLRPARAASTAGRCRVKR